MLEAVHFFEKNGYVAIPNIFSGSHIEALGRDLDDWLFNVSRDHLSENQEYAKKFEVRVDVGLADHLATAMELFSSAIVKDLTTSMLQPAWEYEGPPLIFSTPLNGQQGWHQDTSDPDPSHYMLNRIIYPRQIYAEQGGLVVVPGSHKMGDIPVGENHEDINGQIQLFPQSGTLVFMHSRCWHRVQINRSTRPRIQLNWRGRPASAPANLGNNPVFRTGRWDFAKGK